MNSPFFIFHRKHWAELIGSKLMQEGSAINFDMLRQRKKICKNNPHRIKFKWLNSTIIFIRREPNWSYRQFIHSVDPLPPFNRWIRARTWLHCRRSNSSLSVIIPKRHLHHTARQTLTMRRQSISLQNRTEPSSSSRPHRTNIEQSWPSSTSRRSIGHGLSPIRIRTTITPGTSEKWFLAIKLHSINRPIRYIHIYVPLWNYKP